MKARHTYRIKHRGIESTPYSLRDLRQMWKSGQIDASTEFRRGDSEVWLEANDLLPELEFSAEDTSETITAPPPSVHGLDFSGMTAIAPHSVRLSSIRVPFREILVVVLKIYAAVFLIAAALTALWVLLGYLLR
jgi:hypothetical protein